MTLFQWRSVLFLLLASATLSVALCEARKVDINVATASELESLPGIGPALARRIIEHRKKNGPFKRIEDLMNVRGIGEKKFLDLEERITVGKESPGSHPGEGDGSSAKTDR